MATIKSYTDLKQSKVLAEILPLESADMMYQEYETVIGDDYGYKYRIQPFYSSNIDGIPCWSLAALRNLLPAAIKVNKKNTYLFESHNTFNKSWVYRYYNENNDSYLYYNFINEIDACYEMILKLHELNLL